MSDENPKIAALRERQASSRDGMEERKIINFRDRSPYVHVEAPEKPVQAPEEPPQPVLDQDAIDLLESVLIKARKGAVRGCVVLTGMPTSDDPELVTDIRADLSYTAAENIQIFLGGMETAKADLFEMHGDILLIEEVDAVEDDDEDED